MKNRVKLQKFHLGAKIEREDFAFSWLSSMKRFCPSEGSEETSKTNE
jgi:hypothetical protein